jgi:hypothetical protein
MYLPRLLLAAVYATTTVLPGWLADGVAVLLLCLK